MRRLLVLILSLLLLAGCAGDSGPAEAAREYYEALKANNKEKALRWTCQAEHDFVEKVFSVATPAGGAVTKVDLSGVRFEVVSRNGDTAEVATSGTLKLSFGTRTAQQIADSDGMNALMKFENGWKFCGVKK